MGFTFLVDSFNHSGVYFYASVVVLNIVSHMWICIGGRPSLSALVSMGGRLLTDCALCVHSGETTTHSLSVQAGWRYNNLSKVGLSEQIFTEIATTGVQWLVGGD